MLEGSAVAGYALLGVGNEFVNSPLSMAFKTKNHKLRRLWFPYYQSTLAAKS